MTKLIGKAVGDTLVEFLGPIQERNYNINGNSPAPTITVQLFGTGQVLIEETQNYVFVGNSGNNTYTYESRPDQATFATIATIVGNAPAVTLPVTPDNLYAAIRASVAVVGTGKLVIQSNWQ